MLSGANFVPFVFGRTEDGGTEMVKETCESTGSVAVESNALQHEHPTAGQKVKDKAAFVCAQIRSSSSGIQKTRKVRQEKEKSFSSSS